MSLYAQVIVDVPTMQTNKPYTYLVPSELEDQIQAGMRCVVPFGKGSRKIQGFVLDVSNQKPDEDFEIKNNFLDGLCAGFKRRSPAACGLDGKLHVFVQNFMSSDDAAERYACRL